jgi:hypothetical protein
MKVYTVNLNIVQNDNEFLNGNEHVINSNRNILKRIEVNTILENILLTPFEENALL